MNRAATSSYQDPPVLGCCQQPTTYLDGDGRCCAADANQQRSQHSARLRLQPGNKTARCVLQESTCTQMRTSHLYVAYRDRGGDQLMPLVVLEVLNFDPHRFGITRV